MTTDRHATIGAMLDEYALGQLSQAERRDVENHVRECDVCAADLRELTMVMEGLAHLPEPVTPPPAVRQRVLSSLASLPQEPLPCARLECRRTSSTICRGSAWRASGLACRGRPRHPGVRARPLFLRRHPPPPRRRRAGGAGCDRRGAGHGRGASRVNSIRTGEQADLVVSILTAGDMRAIAMAGRENATGTIARAYWSPTRGLLIVADNLPVPPPGRVYQVWVIGGGKPMSAGLLGEQGSGRGMLIAPPPPAPRQVPSQLP